MTKSLPQESRMPAKLVDFEGYEYVADMTNARRAAHALDWLAKQRPHIYVPWNVLYRVIVGSARIPIATAPEVKQLRASSQRIGKYLLAGYNRCLVSAIGVGIRASVDEADKGYDGFVPRLKRLESAKQSLENLQSHIDVTQIPKTPENEALRQALGAAKQITSYHDRYPILKLLDTLKKS